MQDIKVNVNNKEVTIVASIAKAYAKICTDITLTEDNITKEIQRVADYDTHEDKCAVDRDSLLSILSGRIEHEFNKRGL